MSGRGSSRRRGRGRSSLASGRGPQCGERWGFELAEPVRVEAKGKPGGVVAQQLVRALSLMRPRGVGGLRTVFVGRDAELARLCEAYGRALAEGRPQLVAIVGDAGVGKTRLT